MATDNQTILAKSYLAATNDYQQRIPDPTQSSISQTMQALFAPMNQRYFNQFMDILINRIAYTYVHGKRWDNPLAVFKGQKINYGSTVQEIAPKWIKAHAYEDDSETLLKLHRPEAEAWYHSQNRRDRYPISVSYDELRTAFTDDYGLNNLIAQVMNTPINSDNYDEYRIMVQLIAEYERKWGFFKHHLSAAPSNEETGKEFLTAIRAYAGKLKFPSSLYNGGTVDIPVFTQPNELVLMITPDAQASLDVNTLASVFQLDKADIAYRTIIVDEFPIPDAVALLTTEDFFVCNDTVYTNSSFWNPETLVTDYYLQHWGIYSVSPFVPAILFTTGEGSTVGKFTQSVTGMTLTANPSIVERGGESELTVTLKGNVTPDSGVIKVAPNAATFALSAAVEVGDDEGSATMQPIALKGTTYVDEYGVLHVGKGEKIGTVITITATSTYTNPSGATVPQTATTNVTVS